MSLSNRVETWRVRVQLGGWVGYVLIPKTMSASDAHQMVLDAGWKAANEFNKVTEET